MKVTREAPKFAPITITLETEVDYGRLFGVLDYVVNSVHQSTVVRQMAFDLRQMLLKVP